MRALNLIQYGRNRQAELEFHICRHEWFLDKVAAQDHDHPLRRKINDYRGEWTSYERLIGQTAESEEC